MDVRSEERWKRGEWFWPTAGQLLHSLAFQVEDLHSFASPLFPHSHHLILSALSFSMVRYGFSYYPNILIILEIRDINQRDKIAVREKGTWDRICEQQKTGMRDYGDDPPVYIMEMREVCSQKTGIKTLWRELLLLLSVSLRIRCNSVLYGHNNNRQQCNWLPGGG